MNFNNITSISNQELDKINESSDKDILKKLNVIVYSSDNCGLGKTYKITKEIEKKKKHKVYLPVGGVFEQKTLIKRIYVKNNAVCFFHFGWIDAGFILCGTCCATTHQCHQHLTIHVEHLA